MSSEENELRDEIVATCRALVARGLTHGTSGNVSVRAGAVMLISPSATPYESMTPDMVAAMPLADVSGAWSGPRRPSTEWRMHRDLYRARPDIHALVHCHSREATALSITRLAIPACHYMIAAFGGPTIRCADYATFGTEALSVAVVAGMQGRLGCLMANHGQITAGPTLSRALTLAMELEELSALYRLTKDQPGFTVLDDAEIALVSEKFTDYLAP